MELGKAEQRSFREQVLIAAVLCAASCLTAYVTIILTRQAGFSAFWSANSILALALLVLPRRMAAACIAACLAFYLGLYSFFLQATAQTVVLVGANLIEAVLAAWLTRRVLGTHLKLRTLRSFVRLQLFAVAPTCLATAILVTMVMAATTSPDHSLKLAAAVGWQWFVAHALGLGAILSTLLLLIQPAQGPQRSLGEHVAVITALTVFAYILLHQTVVPTASFLIPMVILAGLRLGPKGASIGSIVVAAIGVPVVLHGAGPFMLHADWPIAFRVGLFQVSHVISFTLSLTTAFAVADNRRMREVLVYRQTVLREARRRALAASKAKTEFLATMSHEIRTPMNSLLGFTQVLLRRSDLKGDARHQLEMIASAGASLVAVVNDILDLSKVEAGRIVLDPRPTDIGRMSHDALAIIEDAALAKGLALDCQVTGLDGPLMVDDQRLHQVLLNLLNNAVKFTAAGRVQLRVRGERRGELDRVRFEVIDTGIGIAPDMRDQLFVRFAQADSSIARSYGGTGLGLAICKRLVELMGGVIGVGGAPQAGSVFWFELDLPRAAAADLAADAVSQDLLVAPRPGRVLLVDDHPMNRELGIKLLEIIGCTVDTAESGEQAIAAVGARAYDLVLMDVHMPGMDGLAATRAIRALLGESGAPPIVAMTADVLPERVVACLDAGMQGHLAKPIDIARLHATVVQWMGAQTLRIETSETV